MKVMVCDRAGTVYEQKWAKQWAGEDPDMKKQFPQVNWAIRSPQVVWITALTWTAIVDAITRAAQAAGGGGLVALATGHGGSPCMSNDVPNPMCAYPNEGAVNFDSTEPPGTKRGWTSASVGRGLFFDQYITTYTDTIPNAMPSTTKEKDEQAIKNKIVGWQVNQKRKEAWEAFVKLGSVLQGSSVRRFTFTVCSVGSSPIFMNQLAKKWKVEVAAFKFWTAVGDDTGNKARLYLVRDTVPGQGTNINEARVYTPDLDNASIAYVAHPHP